MALFQYPKTKHIRTLSPRIYKRYQSYKRTLQIEFARVCVYCRQPDSSAPNLNFGVDHYRPKGNPRFAGLVCDYDNLYYCCGSCNSRKNDYWPEDEKNDRFVVVPCERAMASDLRFNSSNGKIETRSPDGQFTEELLQLNDAASVQYRLSTLRIVSMLASEIGKQEGDIKDLLQLLKTKKISQHQFDKEVSIINSDLDELRRTMRSCTGELPTPDLPKVRLGVRLLV